jgi:hypothetical protein
MGLSPAVLHLLPTQHDSSDVENKSSVSGETVTDALNSLIPAITVTDVKTSAYSIQATDKIVRIDSSSGAFNLQLPYPSLKWFGYIQDVAGALSTYQVTLLRYASEKINNLAASRPIYGDYNTYLVYSDGSNYWVA